MESILAITPPTNFSNNQDSAQVLAIVLGVILFILLMILIVSIGGTKSSYDEKSEDGTTHTVTKTKRHPILAIVSLILIIVVGIALFNQCASDSSSSNISDSTPELLTRSAKDSDISITCEESILNYQYKFTPQVDIADLEITFTYFDKDYNQLCSIVKMIGNVNEGIEYSVTISSSEFSFTDYFSVKYHRSTVTGGDVSYFA